VRVVRRIFGGDVDPAIRPLVILQTFGSMAASCLFTFNGIWALEHLGATPTQLGIAFLVMAGAAMFTGVLGGHISDRIGRRPMMLVGRGVFSLGALGALAAGDNALAGLTVIVLVGALSSLGDAADSAMVADLVGPDEREGAYAALRVASNFGVVLGPPVGGLLLARSWNTLFIGAACLSMVAFVLAWMLIPQRGRYTPEQGDEQPPVSVVFRDRPYMALLAGSVLAYMVYVGFELLLPISAVQHHGIDRSLWGAIVIVNPLLVALLQLRVTNAAQRFSPLSRMVAALALMGPPFLILGVADAVPVVVAIVIVFVFGEMLWVPTLQAIAVDRAPAEQRGAYMGAFNATSGAAFALAPLLGLTVLSHFGDEAMWATMAALAVIGSVVFAIVLRDRHMVSNT
jgi:predicted MFS family arabinose efflux permease